MRGDGASARRLGYRVGPYAGMPSMRQTAIGRVAVMRAPHLQCPFHCDHPQPFPFNDRLYCAACYHHRGELVEMTMCDGSDKDKCEFGEEHSV